MNLINFFSNFVNPIHVILNYIEYHNYFIEKDSIRPQECCLFEKYQLIDINGSIPWCMKNHIKDCFNNWENFVTRISSMFVKNMVLLLNGG